MTSNTLGAAVLATGIWAVFAVGIFAGAPLNPQTHIWVSTASEKIATHPTLVRAAYPVVAPELPRRI